MSCNAQWPVVGLRNVIQNGHLEHVPDCVSSASRRWLKNNDFCQDFITILTHFAESWHLSFTEMHGEKGGGVSCFVQSTHTNIVWTS